MSDEDEAGYRAKLAAQAMRWRLGLGVSSWGIAVASMGFVGLVLTGQSFVHIEGHARLVAYAVPTIGSLLVAGYVLLRVGEIDLQTGRLVRAAPVPWPRIALSVAGVAVIAAFVIAWPLGVYTSLHAARTSCGRLVPIDVLRAHTTSQLSYASVSEDDGCDVTLVAEGSGGYGVVVLRERSAPDDHEWHAQLSRFHPDRREPLFVPADEALLLENDDVLVIALRRGTRASFVQLRREAFDVDDALALARVMSPD